MQWAPVGADHAPGGEVWKKVARQLNPTASRLSPLRYLGDRRLETYYRRTVDDRALAAEWREHYFAGLAVPANAAVLDYGCGRGRHVGLLSQLGFRVGAQDVKPHTWWRQFHRCAFQVVPPAAPGLPWREHTFAAVLDVTVIHHLAPLQLRQLAGEVFRVLMPGGHWLLVEANDESWGAAAPRRYYGHLHSLADVQQLARATGFVEVDHRYDGFYAPVAPTFINFLRKQAWPAPFSVDDFGSRLAAHVPPRRRALWQLRLQKPERHG